ncbi:MAG: OmpA family protein [Rhodobacteraceae bacterium]|nr:OmpA family protein [Paracoccaceae bacterium]
MIRQRTLPILAAISLLTVTACTTSDPNRSFDKTRSGAAIGAMLGAGVGLLRGDGAEGALRGAAIGAAGGALVGNELDKQEADLRKQLGNDVTIQNTGDRLIVTMSQDILFATDSATLRPDLQRDLRTVGQSLLAYPNTTVQVVGHTDNTGSAAHNLDLSKRRATSVASVLITEGVPSGRMQTIGRGEDQPIASNLTAEGRAQNRRVEIVILPNA